MKIEILRQTSNYLYTEGQMVVNGKQLLCTVEATSSMLPKGQYPVRLLKGKHNRRDIVITQSSSYRMNNHTRHTINTGHSWISSAKNNCICIGQQLIPGALYLGIKPYERLFDRIEKCEQRGEEITLSIIDIGCWKNKPITHWM